MDRGCQTAVNPKDLIILNEDHESINMMQSFKESSLDLQETTFSGKL